MVDQSGYAHALLMFESLSDTDKDRFGKQVLGKRTFPFPDKVNGLYWVVIVTFCSALLICVARVTGLIDLELDATMAAFRKVGVDNAKVLEVVKTIMSDDDKVIGMFSTIVSFLAGIFIPSPVSGDAKPSTTPSK
jgi:hypothetical protein